MNKNIIVKISIVIAFFLFITNAEAILQKDSGVYFEANPGWSKVNEEDDNLQGSDDTGFGWNINAGYKINPYIAVEGGYYRFTNEDYDFGYSGSNNYALAGDVKGIVEIGTGFDTIDTIMLFAKLGVADSHHTFDAPTYSTSDSEVTGMGGVGLTVPITAHWSTSIQVEGFTSHDDVPEMFLTSIGLSYII